MPGYATSARARVPGGDTATATAPASCRPGSPRQPAAAAGTSAADCRSGSSSPSRGATPTRCHDALLEADWSRGRLLYSAADAQGARATRRRPIAPSWCTASRSTSPTSRSDRTAWSTSRPAARTTEGGVFPDCLQRSAAGDRQADAAARGRCASRSRSRAGATPRWPGPRLDLGDRMGERPRGAGPRSGGPRRGSGAGDLRAAAPRPGAAGAAARRPDARRRRRRPRRRGVRRRRPGREGRRPSPPSGLKDLSPLVQRRAAEALVRMGQSPSAESLAPVGDLYALLGLPDRFVRSPAGSRCSARRAPRGAIAS